LLNRIVDSVRVERLGDDATTWSRNLGKPPQETARSGLRPEHPEVLAEEDDRVEDSDRRVDGVDSEELSVSHASPAAAFDCPGRGVDPDDLDPAILEVKADSTAAAADVEYAAANEAHGPALYPVVPLGEGREKIPGVESHDESVIALDDLHRTLSGERVSKHSAPNVVPGVHSFG
jgi:hypothetical protein